MTETTYRDGDLAMLTIKATENRSRAVRVAMPQGMQWMTLPSASFFNDDEVFEVGPLVTLDPADDDGDRHRVAAALMSWWDANRSDLGIARGTGHTAGVALQAADHMLNYLATPTTAATSCVCGSPEAQAMAPNERIVHRTDGPCFIEQAVDGLPGFSRLAVADRRNTLDEILTELRRIGDGIDRIAAGTRQATKAGRTEVTHTSKRGA